MSSHPFRNITPSDIINLVNDELSRLNAIYNLGAAVITSLNFGANSVACSSKKFKDSVKLFVNGCYGDFKGFIIHTEKSEGNLATLSGMDCFNAIGKGIQARRERTAEEIEQARLDAEQAKLQKNAEEMARKERAASIYALATETGENEYLARKNVIAHKNVRFDGNKLIIPLYQFDTENNLEVFGVQSIDLTGKITKGLKKNSFFPIGNIETPKSIYFCEGYATGSSIYESLTCKDDSLVVVAVDTGNMTYVVDTFAEKFADIYNSYGFTLCCDYDMWKPKPADRFTGFKIAHEIADKHDKVMISYPFFDCELAHLYRKWCGTDSPTDFNDYAGWDVGNRDAEKCQFYASEFLGKIYDFKSNSMRATAEKQLYLRGLKLNGLALDLGFFEKPPVDLADKNQIAEYIKQNPNKLTPSLHSNGVSSWYKINKPFLDDADLSNIIKAEQETGRVIAVFVVSGTGSNKTGAAVNLTRELQDLTAIAISHRIALEANMNQRFNTAEDGNKINNFQSYEFAGRESERVTAVANSVGKFAQKQIVIADESTQIDRHLARIEARDKPLKIAQAYEKHIKGAQIIVRMDAHYTDADLIREREQLPPNTKVIVLVNEYQKTHVVVDGVARRRTFRVHPFSSANQKTSGRGYVLNSLDKHLGAGERAVFYSNTKDSARRDVDLIAFRHGLKTLRDVATEHGMSPLDYATAHGLRGVQYVFVTQDNAGEFAPILRSSGNWAEKLKDVQLFGFTPIIGAGVDISKAGFYKGFGIFAANTTTSREIIQQANRFRDVFDLVFAVETKNYQLEENPTEILRKSSYLAQLSHDEIRRFAIATQIAGISESPHKLSQIEIAHAEIEASDNRDKNNLLKSLEFWAGKEGYDFAITEEAGEFEGISDAKSHAESQRIHAILNAPVIENDIDFELLSKKTCTESQTYSKERYKIERFYDAPISEELIEFDDHGKQRAKIRNERLMVTSLESVQENAVREYLEIQDIGLRNLQLLTIKRSVFEVIYRTARLFAFDKVIYSLESIEDFELLLQSVRDFRLAKFSELEKLAKLKKTQIASALKVLENPEISSNEITVLVNGLLNGKRPTQKKFSKIKDILLSLKGFSVYGVLWKIAQLTGTSESAVRQVEKLLESENILKAVDLLSNGIQARQKCEILAELKSYFTNKPFTETAIALNALRDGLPRFETGFLDDDKKLWLYYKNMLGLHGISLKYESAKSDSAWSKIYTTSRESILANRPFLLKKSE